MVLESVVSILCLVIMAIGLCSVVVSLATKNRADKITYIRGFKKGKGVLIYVVAIPLLWVGHTYGGATVIDGFFGAVRRVVELVVLKYDVSPVQALFDQSPLYATTLYICFVLIALNAVMFALSLLSQGLWKWKKGTSFRYKKGEKLMIFGNNLSNRTIYESENKRPKIIVDEPSGIDELALYMKNIAYIQTTAFDGCIKKAVQQSVTKSQRLFVVINTEDEDKNIYLCRSFIDSVLALSEEHRARCFELLRVYVFGDPRYETIYCDIVKDGFGCISYVNKHQRIAVNFVDKFPFTRFMDERHIDYDTSLIKDGVDINALMIGFGKTNQQIFLTSVANNQFITESGGEVVLKRVRYHLFDKNPAENNKNLNHSYNRYKNECDGKDYLPLPDYPAEECFHRLDVNDAEFYNGIRKIVTASSRDLNFVIIAFGSDLENIDMAQKISAKAREWGVDNLTVFVKVRGEHEGEHLLPDGCYFIGNELKAVYDIDDIISDAVSNMAMLRNEIYDVESVITKEHKATLTEGRISAIRESAHKGWYTKKSQLERESSLYCCLSLRAKLNMMGLDYCPIGADERIALTEEEYLEIYAKTDMPDRSYYPLKVDGKAIVRYTLDFPVSRRKSMAIHEHLRWNSFMISKGIIPATKAQILNEKIILDGKEKHTNGKNYAVRRHGNLTTFDGLIEFRKMIAERDNVCEEETDVIKYDYQILDDAHWLLSKTGNKIVRR